MKKNRRIVLLCALLAALSSAFDRKALDIQTKKFV